MHRWLVGALISGLLIGGGVLAGQVQGPDSPAALALVLSGLALIFVVAVMFLVVRLASAFRPPTRGQLSDQRADNARTWHLRPFGLLVYLGLIGGAIVLSLWFGARLPEQQDILWRAPYGVALLLGLSLSFRPLRDFLFYTGEPAERGRAGEPPPGARPSI